MPAVAKPCVLDEQKKLSAWFCGYIRLQAELVHALMQSKHFLKELGIAKVKGSATNEQKLGGTRVAPRYLCCSPSLISKLS